jgi:hypothetical protein
LRKLVRKWTIPVIALTSLGGLSLVVRNGLSGANRPLYRGSAAPRFRC